MQTSVRDWSASMAPASAICTQRVWHDSFMCVIWLIHKVPQPSARAVRVTQRIHIYVWLILNGMSHSHMCIDSYITCRSHFDRKKPPPVGFPYLLCSLIKNPEKEDPPRSAWYKFFEGGPLPLGSWLGNIVNRKPPRGEGFLSINLHVDFMSVLLFHCANNAHVTRMDELCHAYEWVISHT